MIRVDSYAEVIAVIRRVQCIKFTTIVCSDRPCNRNRGIICERQTARVECLRREEVVHFRLEVVLVELGAFRGVDKTLFECCDRLCGWRGEWVDVQRVWNVAPDGDFITELNWTR